MLHVPLLYISSTDRNDAVLHSFNPHKLRDIFTLHVTYLHYMCMTYQQTY